MKRTNAKHKKEVKTNGRQTLQSTDTKSYNTLNTWHNTAKAAQSHGQWQSIYNTFSFFNAAVNRQKNWRQRQCVTITLWQHKGRHDRADSEYTSTLCKPHVKNNKLTCTCVGQSSTSFFLVQVYSCTSFLHVIRTQLYSITETVQHVTQTVQRDWPESCCFGGRNCDELASNFFVQVFCARFLSVCQRHNWRWLQWGL